MTRIVIIDNHGQFTHLEGRTLRDIDVETETVDNTTPPADIDADGLILSGGPGSATDADTGGRCGEYLDLDVPVLGICLGMQVIADECGGEVEPGEYGGYADVMVEIDDDTDPLVGSLAPETRVWTSHADQVTTLPDEFTKTGASDVCAIESMSNPDRGLYGVQWHPEVAHTDEGMAVFENFRAICE